MLGDNPTRTDTKKDVGVLLKLIPSSGLSLTFNLKGNVNKRLNMSKLHHPSGITPYDKVSNKYNKYVNMIQCVIRGRFNQVETEISLSSSKRN